MAKAKLYVNFNISPSSHFVTIIKFFSEDDLQKRYKEYVSDMESLDAKRWESIDGFQISHLHLDVRYDGRKKRITEQDVLNAFEEEGFAVKVGSNIYGGLFKPTAKLKSLMEENLQKRRVLAGV